VADVLDLQQVDDLLLDELAVFDFLRAVLPR